MRIKCPECGGVLSLDQAKPGNYRPKCKHCQQPFRLKITGEDPPQAVVNRVPSQPDLTRHAESHEDVGATIGANAIGANAIGANTIGANTVHATLDDHRTLPADSGTIPDRLGGYKILRLIGKGAMGSVFEAKQVSLDRLVALKTIRGRLTDSPATLARFAREAYAAAQLTHHNVVQIYDFGEDAGRYYFSMEWVRGGPLDQLIREKGALDPKLAAGYALQAARGLQYAHRHGMVHRDIKPANLLLSDEGVIKVADLGLVKIPDAADVELDARTSSVSGMASGTQVTMQGTAVGTPAYMAPEQGIDAATVDHRADIYSLGCSLFCMLTGHPPFDGSDVSKVMEQHAKQPFPSLQQSNARIPDALERVVMKATAKRPSDRYASVSEMIEELEQFLGIRSGGTFSPSKTQADAWESIAAAYHDAAPWTRLSRPLWLAGTVACVGLTIVVPFVRWNWWMLGPSIWTAALATVSLLSAHDGKSAVTTKVRAWIGSMSWADWAIGLAGILIGMVIVVMLSWWPGALVGLTIGGIVGAVYHTAFVIPSQRGHDASLHDAERFVRDLRIDGADEQGLRQFIAGYSGPHWQSFFEDLFGYDALCQLRERTSGASNLSGPGFSTDLRDKFCHWLSTKTKANLEARDRRQLARIEERGLASEGLSAEDARERAWQMAAAIMDGAHANASPAESAQPGDAEASAVREKRARMKAMLADARSGRYRKHRDKLAPLKFALSGQTRLLLGCLLLAWFAVKGQHEGIFDAFTTLDAGQVDLDQFGSAILDTAATAAADANAAAETTASRTSTWSLGVAGLLLAASAFVSGWRMTPFALVATIAILFGPSLGIPAAGPLPAWIVSIAAGMAIYVPGILFGESRDD